MSNSNKKTAQYYDRLSPWYDLLTGSSENQITGHALDFLDIKPGEKLLEIGFGTGNAIPRIISKVGEAGVAVGLDLSMGMCQQTRRKLTSKADNHLPLLIQGDACFMPLKSATFDGIFMSFTLELLSAEQMYFCLDEIKRLLVSGGRFGLVSLLSEESPRFAERAYTKLHQKFPQVLDCRPIPVESILVNVGYTILTLKRFNLWGIPVGCVVAHAGIS